MIYETACRFFEQQMTPELISSLQDRYGFTDSTIRNNRIGYCPIGEDIFLLSLFETHPREEIRVSGLFHETADGALIPVWRGRYMFPYQVSGQPVYFIGRRIEGVTTDDTWKEGRISKYKKQLVTNKNRSWLKSYEPIFGIDTVQAGQPLIITEGIADCISVHQAGYSGISPVTVQFKDKHAEDMADLCRTACAVYIIMDSEESAAGTAGAVRTGLRLSDLGIPAQMADIPRPDGVDKVDLNDYLRTGGCIEDLFSGSYNVTEHPLAKEIIKEKWRRVTRDELIPQCKDAFFRSIKTKKRSNPEPRAVERYPMDILKNHLPSMATVTGIPLGSYGPHPVYGSSSGANLRISDDGEHWFCFSKGREGDGDILKWYAIFDLKLGIHESEPLTGSLFLKALKYAWEKHVPMNERPIR